MPHIVLERAKNVKSCFDNVKTEVKKVDDTILKITDKYLNEKNNSALIEAIVVEKGNSQNFFVQLSSKKDAVTVRLFAKTDPQKTDGVKQIMANIAHSIKSNDPEISYGKTNLQDFLID
jgi:hypothetical protein